MLRNEDVAEVLQRPEVLGRLVGFTDLTALHGEWIHEMVFGDEDYTLQAHRGAFKSSCLAVAIPLYMVLYPNRNVIFLRKTDHDVGEMMNMVAKVLQSDVMRDFTMSYCNRWLKITEQSMFALLVILGIVVDPTTVGVGDSKRALGYQEPWTDVK